MTPALDAARAALAGTPAWVVGGAVRDELLGRPSEDLDVAVAGEPRAAARALATSAGAFAFELSGEFGAWRVLARDRSWHVDISALQGDSIEADLAQRDFTVNAMARALDGGELLDPHDGRADLEARRLRMVSASAFDQDPLRTLRLARFACEVGLEPEPATEAAARAHAPGIAEVAAERVFGELKRVVTAERAVDGLALMDRIGVTEHVLPELSGLRGVEQNRYHHLDVHDHTLAVLAAAIELERDPGAVFGDELAGALRAHLDRPLADELTRAGGLRFGALLHDVAKPQTQARDDDGEVLGFPGHAEEGADVARDVLARLRASERLRAHVAALTRHHLRLGFLVHQAPLDRRAIHRYLMRTAPVQVDVTLLSVADRLATRGHKGDESIARHLDVARLVLPFALAFDEEAGRAPLVRGDDLAGALGIRPGPELGRLLAEIAEARFAGEVATRDEAVELARRLSAPGAR